MAELSWVERMASVKSQQEYSELVDKQPIVVFFKRASGKIFLLVKVTARVGDNAWTIIDFMSPVIMGPTRVQIALKYFTAENGYEVKEYQDKQSFFRDMADVV